MPQEQNPAEAVYEPFTMTLADVERAIPDDLDAARVAFNLLFIQATEGDIDVYARPVRDAGGHQLFNVWDNHTQTCIPLEDWCAHFRLDYADFRRKQRRNGGAL